MFLSVAAVMIYFPAKKIKCNFFASKVNFPKTNGVTVKMKMMRVLVFLSASSQRYCRVSSLGILERTASCKFTVHKRLLMSLVVLTLGRIHVPFLTASERNKESGSDQDTKSEIRTCEVSNVGKNCETINKSH